HCIGWPSSAPRSRIATKPAVLPIPHTQRRSVSSHISPGKLRPRPRPRGDSVGEKETAALAAAMWSPAPDRQRPIVRFLFLRVQERRGRRGGMEKGGGRGGAAAVGGRVAPAVNAR